MINRPPPPSTLEFSGAPAPMAPLTHVVISPQNIALEARLSRAKPMGKLTIWKLKREAKRLEKQIQKLKPEQTAARLEAVKKAYQQLLIQRADLAEKHKTAPDHSHIKPVLVEVLKALRTLKNEGITLQKEHDGVQELIRARQSILQRIEDNPQVIERQRRVEESHRIQMEESRAYEQLIVERFTQLGYCYRWSDKHGNKKVEMVRFSECHITMDAVFFKVAASYRAMFGAWKTKLPYGVKIADLIKDETLIELAFACQRQITAKANFITGAWIIVHRIDTVDGLLNQVSYPEVMKNYPRKYHSRFPLCVGVAQHKEVKWLNLVDYRHWLVAGFTGSGKSNFINSIICNLISMHSPEEIRLILVDLKDGIEFTFYENIPHLHGEIVDKISVLADKLNELEAIMQARNQEMRGKAKSLQEYQAKFPDVKMPRIICIIDEVASTMAHGELTKRITNSLRALTSKGRAPGIHIILSTQRPSVDAIDGTIKVNLAARIVGRMPSNVDSQTVLGTGAAKDLAAIAGRMIMMIGPDPIPIQTPFIEEGDINHALKRAMEYPPGEPLPVPEGFKGTENWTTEKIVEMSLTFLDGNIGHNLIWKEIKEDGGITQNQLREMVRQIWATDCIMFDGKQYRVQRGARNLRRLVEINQPVNQSNSDMPMVTD